MTISPHLTQARHLSRGHLLVTLGMVLSVLLMLFITLSVANSQADDVLELTEAKFIVSESEQPPLRDDAAWQSLHLPDLWWGRKLVSDSGWYRFNIPVDKTPEDLQGIYIFRLHMNAAVFFNGELLGDGGNMKEPLARNWNRPLYFNIPSALWRKGNNELQIHLRTYPGFGMLASPQIASDHILKPRYQWRQFLQNELSLAFTAVLLALSLFTFGLWLKRRADYQYLWFSLSCLCWSIFNSSLYVRYAPIPPELYQKLTHIALDFWMVFLVGFVHRILNVTHPRREQLLAAIQFILCLIFLIFPMTIAYSATHISHAVTLLMAIYLTVLTWRHWVKQNDMETLAMSIALTTLVFAGFHDWLMENPIPGLVARKTLETMWRHQFHLLFFMVPALAMFFAWHLTQRYIKALNEAEHLNSELEHRVEIAQQVLAASFEEMRVLEMTRAAEGERERIYRDLHDDVGAKLLGLAISAQRSNQIREADLARSALQDLRDIVSRSTHSISMLDNLLADMRAETEQRLSSAGVILIWDILECYSAQSVSAAAALNISRLLRESITNALRHAQPTRIQIGLLYQGDTLTLTVADDGIGLPKNGIKPSRGMSNMRMRAIALGGSVAWECLPSHGCRVNITISVSHISPALELTQAIFNHME
jgi:signal transduction histidine kinase